MARPEFYVPSRGGRCDDGTLNQGGARIVTKISIMKPTQGIRHFSALTRCDMGMLIWQVPPQPAKAKLLTPGLLVAAQAIV